MRWPVIWWSDAGAVRAPLSQPVAWAAVIQRQISDWRVVFQRWLPEFLLLPPQPAATFPEDLDCHSGPGGDHGDTVKQPLP